MTRRLAPFLLVALAAATAAPSSPIRPDENLWLEDILREKAISWVKANRRAPRRFPEALFP